MPQMSGAQALARQLRSEGVDTVFTLPGVQIMAAFDALHEVQDDIQLIHTRHEQATTYMADGYAKVTGKVGVAMVVPGPGALNATAGLGTAFASSSPVLLISGQIASNALGKRQGQLHEVEDQLDVFKPITKWNHRVTEVGEIPEAVHEAFRQLNTGRPRPVELEVPPDTLAAMGNADIIEPEIYPPAAADSTDIDRAAEILARAERPAIIAGGGTIISGASDELREVAEFLQAAVMTTQQGKGIIPDDHELLVGVNYAMVEPVKDVLPECDALLAVGTRLLFRVFSPDSVPPVVHIDADADEIGKNLPTEVGIVGDAKQALRQLLERLQAISAPKESRRDEVAAYRKSADDNLTELATDQLRMIQDIRGAMADDDILISGMTNIGYWSNVAYPVNVPRTFITSSYFGTLGYAYPTALGAQVGQARQARSRPMRRRRLHVQHPGAFHRRALRHQRRRRGVQQPCLRRIHVGPDAPVRPALHRHRLEQSRLPESSRSLRRARNESRAGQHRRRAPTGICRKRAGAAGSRAAQHDAAVPDSAVEE